jgi:tetratricopeptide (TPR) repeat protein
MEDDLLQLAKDAQVKVTVPDVLTLKAWVPLTKAKFAYQLGQFQDAIKQAESSLAIKPDFATADWAIGISYGRLGQWDLAVANLKAALKIDKNNDDFKSAVKWANEGQRAAKSGKAPKAPPPLWN